MTLTGSDWRDGRLHLTLSIVNPMARLAFAGALLRLACTGSGGAPFEIEVRIDFADARAASGPSADHYVLAPGGLPPGSSRSIELDLETPGAAGPLDCRRADLIGTW